MTLSERLVEYISACFTGLWIHSFEHEDALREIAALCRDRDWRVVAWDIERGLRAGGTEQPADAGGSDLGVPGTGKSAFSKALGAETGRPTLILDVGALLGSLVGQTEQNVRMALKIIDAMAPCVCMIDEVEKALSGAANSGQTDSGVSARLFGTLLSWMNDRTSDVFLICTCNDISKLPPEFSRSERFDGIWFLDLPDVQQKRAIWRIYLDMFGLDPKQPKPVDADWTGAEVRSCCRLAALLDVPLVEAAQNVVPVARTAHESVERLWTWASGRCLDADRGGIYSRSPSSAIVKPGRGPPGTVRQLTGLRPVSLILLY